MHLAYGRASLCAILLGLACGDDGKPASTSDASAGTSASTTSTTAATTSTTAPTTTAATGTTSGSSSGGSSSGALCLLWPDADGDHFGAQGDPVEVPCDSPGHVDNGDDCDDAAETIHPGADEGVADGVDQDCDSLELCYVDVDGDGFRPNDASTSPSPALDCSAPGVVGASAPTGDCLDSNADVFPGQTKFFGDDRGDGSFDYNCDAAEEKQYTGLHTCYAAMSEGACMSAQGGWGLNTPGCGYYDSHAASCAWSNGSCIALSKDTQQRCR